MEGIMGTGIVLICALVVAGFVDDAVDMALRAFYSLF